LDDLDALWRKLSPIGTQKGWVVVEFRIRFPDKRKRDAGNLLKAALDGLQHCGAIEDDRWALPRVMSVGRAPEDGEGEFMAITIRAADPADIPAGDRIGSRQPIARGV
jgi:Holliday junction resolvase RusA-like endonuclease